ncbi:MAG: hypothetical protein CVU89_06815 [Firmicutes bacterium HGW-Firmicutes-14]|nr:MAG: hypothetical protein CVU89_06815 [Firmicutes bacterium HGW-Firmicutes-14]
MNIKDMAIKHRFITVLFCFVCLVPLNITTRVIMPSKVCAGCHMMKPEYNTWRVSSHSGVSCVSCHIAPGPWGVLKGYADGVKNIYSMAVGNYVSPITMLTPTSDAACERCHDVREQKKSKSGSLVVAHELHKKIKVPCFKCHRGIAHGRISERSVTFESDYKKWDVTLGEFMMEENQYTDPEMDMCFSCHRLRNAPLECKACHIRSVLPDAHRDEGFQNGGHGKRAAENLKACDNCHRFMSDQNQNTEGLKEDKTYLEYIGAAKKQEDYVSVISYSRTNSFCKACHGKRPPSHDSRYIEKHGPLAEQNKKRCATCHDNYVIPGAQSQSGQSTIVTQTGCNKCHPSIHQYSYQWKKGYHPTDLPANPRITRSCYTCHPEGTCSGCHGSLE